MRKYYSQNGEDFLLWSLYNDQSYSGFFVEVGALDGIRLSNTYSFELEGWFGVCIEPHPDYYNLLKQNRPASYCVRVAAGNRTEIAKFYAEPRGEFSTMIDRIVKNDRYKSKLKGYEIIYVQMNKLDRILEDVKAPVPIDIVSIDVEGAELLVLKGFDISYYKPRVMIIEANDSSSSELIDNYMKKYKYIKAGRLGANNIYCRNRLDAIKLSWTSLRCNIYSAPHPLHPKKDIDDRWKVKRISENRLIVQKWKKIIIKYVKWILRKIGNKF